MREVWSRADFRVGDYVQHSGRWLEVLRVNPKSVTVPAMISDGCMIRREGNRLDWTDILPYDKVRGRKSAAEIAVSPRPFFCVEPAGRGVGQPVMFVDAAWECLRRAGMRRNRWRCPPQ